MPETENAETKTPSAEPRITIDCGTARWDKIVHIFDREGHEITLQYKDATSVARRILSIAKVVEHGK
jgi:hypothetical protein